MQQLSRNGTAQRPHELSSRRCRAGAAFVGFRFNETVRSIRFRDRSVADILNMGVDEATEFFRQLL